MSHPRKKLWGGRFTRSTALEVERFTHSLGVDQRLARVDLLGSIAHAKMLGKTRIIPRSHSNTLVKALQALLKELEGGRFKPDPSAEDIHTAIHLALEKKAGSAAQYLHTARSRNDQVVTSLRLYCKEKMGELRTSVQRLQKEVLNQAERSGKLILPGCTHLRHAQPVLVGHHLLAYLEMLERDRERASDAIRRTDALPLGSGALAGTRLPVDRTYVAKQLGFSRVMENSIDGVSSRDFVVEILAALSILAVHLSRIAEDLILWSTTEFGFVRFDEALLTGSSMMPQKQNPDFLELVRGGSARVTGNLTGILNLLKALPTGYQRDLQNDKEFLFEALDRVEGMLAVLTRGFEGLHWNRKNLSLQLEDESLYATDLAEYLVIRGVPFTHAHQAVGRLLAYADRQGSRLRSLSIETFRRFSPAFDFRVYRLLDPLASVGRKKSSGSTNPRMVAQAIRRWHASL